MGWAATVVKPVFAISAFLAMWALCIVACVGVPLLPERNALNAAPYAMTFGAFGVFVGPVVAAAVLFLLLKRAGSHHPPQPLS